MSLTSSKKFDGTSFGSVTFSGIRYDHDIYVSPDGKVERRPSSHIFEAEEIRKLLKYKPSIIVLGTGQSGCVTLSKEAKKLLEESKVKVIIETTPSAIIKFNELVEKGESPASIIHVTC